MSLTDAQKTQLQAQVNTIQQQLQTPQVLPTPAPAPSQPTPTSNNGNLLTQLLNAQTSTLPDGSVRLQFNVNTTRIDNPSASATRTRNPDLPQRTALGRKYLLDTTDMEDSELTPYHDWLQPHSLDDASVSTENTGEPPELVPHSSTSDISSSNSGGVPVNTQYFDDSSYSTSSPPPLVERLVILPTASSSSSSSMSYIHHYDIEKPSTDDVSLTESSIPPSTTFINNLSVLDETVPLTTFSSADTCEHTGDTFCSHVLTATNSIVPRAILRPAFDQPLHQNKRQTDGEPTLSLRSEDSDTTNENNELGFDFDPQALIGYGVVAPEYYLGPDIKRVDKDVIDNCVLTMGSTAYVKRCLHNYKRLLGLKPPPKKIFQPMNPKYHPELDTTVEFNSQDRQIYWSLIGMLQWAVTIGRIDIHHAVMCMSKLRAQPKQGHLQAVCKIFGYLNNYKTASIKFLFFHIDGKDNPADVLTKSLPSEIYSHMKPWLHWIDRSSQQMGSDNMAG